MGNDAAHRTDEPGLTRRSLLKLAGATGLAVAAGPALDLARRASADPIPVVIPPRNALWTIVSPVMLADPATVAGVVIEPGGELVFDPSRNVTLTSTRNVIVRGRLSMRPASADVAHRLLFTGVSESAFVGGGLDPLDSDIGLWVMGEGVLDLAGSPRTAWARVVGGLGRGAQSLTLDADPVGWRAGDQLVVTPTGVTSDTLHYARFETVTVTGVSGRTIGFSPALASEHPEVRTGTVMRAEVLNLTRNVAIEGTSSGRTHVFIRSTRPQSLSHVGLRYVGPRHSSTTLVLGRYGLHFHHCMDGSRGSVVDSVVIRDAGNHAFVPHMSDGTTFRDCVAYGVQEDAYWWDVPEATHDTLIERCVAAKVTADARSQGYYSLNGFTLGHGRGNRIAGSVAVGVVGGKTASGFNWPSQAPADGMNGEWVYEDCVAHNNRWNGIYVWQNDPLLGHVISRYTAFRNGGAGIKHGAYVNSYLYQDAVLVENKASEIEIHAQCRDAFGTTPPRFVRVQMDHGGGDWCVQTFEHQVAAPWAPVLLQDCRFTNYARAGFRMNSRRQGGWFRLENCTYSGNGFWFESAVPANATVDVVDATHGSIRLRRRDQGNGTFVAGWNARVSSL
ncbi:MAG TPA: hypothetical protein VID69_07860 [Actinomycetota bacterium]|jgi:hypothetical protein